MKDNFDYSVFGLKKVESKEYKISGRWVNIFINGEKLSINKELDYVDYLNGEGELFDINTDNRLLMEDTVDNTIRRLGELGYVAKKENSLKEEVLYVYFDQDTIDNGDKVTMYIVSESNWQNEKCLPDFHCRITEKIIKEELSDNKGEELIIPSGDSTYKLAKENLGEVEKRIKNSSKLEYHEGFSNFMDEDPNSDYPYYL